MLHRTYQHKRLTLPLMKPGHRQDQKKSATKLLESCDSTSSDKEDRWSIAEKHLFVSRIQYSLGDFSGALGSIHQGLPLLVLLADKEPCSTEVREKHIEAHYLRGRVMEKIGKLTDAEVDYVAAVSLKARERDMEGSRKFQYWLLKSHRALASLYFYTGKLDYAYPLYVEALQYLENFIAQLPKKNGFEMLKVEILYHLGMIHRARNEATPSEAAFRKAEELYRQLSLNQQDESATHSAFSNLFGNRGQSSQMNQGICRKAGHLGSRM